MGEREQRDIVNEIIAIYNSHVNNNNKNNKNKNNNNNNNEGEEMKTIKYEDVRKVIREYDVLYKPMILHT